jgi:hypothetical protein
MKNRKLIILIVLLAFSLPFMYGGCVLVFSSGDLDNDKDKNDAEDSNGFRGVTSQAAITPLNAETLARGALEGSTASNGSTSLKLSQSSAAAQFNVFRTLRFPLALGDALRRIELGTVFSNLGRPNVITESGNLEGSCGGEFSYTLTLDRLSGKFNGNLLFASYCDAGIKISGETAADGTFEVSTGDFNSATFSFDDLSDDSHTLNGEISMDFTDTPISATFSAYNKDRNTGKVYWIKDYSLNLFESTGHVEIEIFGSFYHPDYGFVTLTTSEPFVVHDEDDWPTSGQLAIEGNSHTKARLITIDYLHYRIEADTEGDGIFDWDSGILFWNDL